MHLQERILVLHLQMAKVTILLEISRDQTATTSQEKMFSQVHFLATDHLAIQALVFLMLQNLLSSPDLLCKQRHMVLSMLDQTLKATIPIMLALKHTFPSRTSLLSASPLLDFRPLQHLHLRAENQNQHIQLQCLPSIRMIPCTISNLALR